MNRKEAQIAKMLASIVRCEQCSRSIPAEDIALIGQKEECWFFMVRCTECEVSRVVVALVREEDDQRCETLCEAEAANSGVPVSPDDVLETHLFLQNFDGDFNSLFTSK